MSEPNSVPDKDRNVKCPCCFTSFLLSSILWIDPDESLQDDVLVDTSRKRFRPDRFTHSCKALSDSGEECKRQFACPTCHMEIPHIYLGRKKRNIKPLFVPIVGTTSAGKTYFLVALHEKLQGKKDNLSYTAALHTSQNRVLEKLAQRLFHPKASTGDFAGIRGTEEDEISSTVKLRRQGDKHVANPFIYSLQNKAEGTKYALCMYDCKGALFTQGEIDKTTRMFQEVLLDNDFFFFLYDPTQNTKCREEYLSIENKETEGTDGKSNTRKLTQAEARSQNDALYEEQSFLVFNAVSQFIVKNSLLTRGLIDEDDKYTKRLYIIVTKCDAWRGCLPGINKHLDNPPQNIEEGRKVVSVVSEEVESWLAKHDEKFVNAVSSFAKNYIYVPVSATGRHVKTYIDKVKDENGREVDKEMEGYDVEENPLEPCWVDIPFLHAFFLRDEDGI